MRIAYFSPLNPIPSGISDYSEDLLPYLARYGEVDLFIDRGYLPVNPDVVAHFRIERYTRFPRVARRRGYDAVLYHVGNNPAHDYIVTMLERYPGVVVLHDYVLHHLMVWRAFRHGNGKGYLQAMAGYGEAGRRLAAAMARGRLLEGAFHYPLCEGVAGAARGMIVHSRYVAGRVREVRPDMPLAVVPMGVPQPVLPGREEARWRLNLPADALILASFGHINPYKRLEPALRAFRRLRERYPEAILVLVGSVSHHYDLEGLLGLLDLGGTVRVTGFVELGAFLGYLAASDICVNLRHPTAGETSASLLRILASSLPTLVSRTGAFAELPAEVAIQVDAGGDEEEEIFAFLDYLAGHPEARRFFGENARRYVETEHTPDGAAAGYVRFLAGLCGIEVPPPQRPALFCPQTGRPAPLPESIAAPSAQEEPVPPLVDLVAQFLAEMGVEEGDVASLRAAAETLASLPEIVEEGETACGDTREG